MTIDVIKRSPDESGLVMTSMSENWICECLEINNDKLYNKAFY
jgi:hypothetical protein